MSNLSYYYTVYNTEIGAITIVSDGETITNVMFGEQRETCKFERELPIHKKTIFQIEEYLEGKRQVFDIPICPHGTEFQKAVWSQLCNISYGETKSYKQIAELIGKHKACRAVGLANNKNPIVILIPCHRVIGADGGLVGYGGGLGIKKHLLEIERINR